MIQPSRLWLDKTAFWNFSVGRESLQLTDQSTTLGNSLQHRLHQLKVRSRLRDARGTHDDALCGTWHVSQKH